MTDFRLPLEGTKIEVKGSDSTGILTRSAESWQFFAFIFASLVALSFSLLEEWMLVGWRRTIAKLVAFCIIGYFTLQSRRGRNALVRLLGVFKTERYR